MIYELNNKNCYMDNTMSKVIDRKLKEVEDDGDLICTVTSGEGYGKSTFAQILGGYIAKTMGTKFGIDNIHFEMNSFISFAEDAPKHTVVILDESRAELYRSNSASKKNKNFTTWLSQCRQKNLILIFLIPSMHDFDPYINKWRVGIWFDLVKRKNQDGTYKRGYYYLMALKKRKVFIKFLEKKYSTIPHSLRILRAEFKKVTPIDDKEYQNKKDKFRKKQFIEKKEEEKQITLTPRQIEVIGSLSPDKVLQRGSKDYEVLKKLVYSLRKWGLGESG